MKIDPTQKLRTYRKKHARFTGCETSMNIAMKKATEKMKANRTHYQHQRKDGKKYKGNSTIIEITDIVHMSHQRIIRKESTTPKTTLSATATIEQK